MGLSHKLVRLAHTIIKQTLLTSKIRLKILRTIERNGKNLSTHSLLNMKKQKNKKTEMKTKARQPN